MIRQDLPAVLPKNQCTNCGAWVSDELKDEHTCPEGKLVNPFPEPPEGFKNGGWYQGHQYFNGSLSDKGVLHDDYKKEQNV